MTSVLNSKIVNMLENPRFAENQKGNLNGRKMLPLPYYLLKSGAVIGGVATVACGVAAIGFSTLPMLVAALACGLVCLSSAVGSFYIERLSHPNNSHSLNSQLPERIHNPNKIDEYLKNANENLLKAESSVEKHTSEINVLHAQLRLKEAEIEDRNKMIKSYLKILEEGRKNVEKDLQTIVLFLKDRGENEAQVQQVLSLLNHMRSLARRQEKEEESADCDRLLKDYLNLNERLLSTLSILPHCFDKYRVQMKTESNLEGGSVKGVINVKDSRELEIQNLKSEVKRLKEELEKQYAHYQLIDQIIDQKQELEKTNLSKSQESSNLSRSFIVVEPHL
ncbi:MULTISPECIES: hypothetical protein [unclassified Neochlamydia]|uniref:hypothetical protein n=1 Tax=unclassified Neochlamydia TaxID=2643326 RepID=UPI00140DEE47|nr:MULTISPECIES: hypothetical protein [unclassified Neochlamydia]MBS4165965.1 Uncharacterized protein [Neochlamydia sp. AcF65]MBS4169831.1 Uncharacterized protein [Neochlamydia sp. AcF95]NGY95937.1 hypothetical protein [Neochlamydia sp. AcF84]